MSAPVAPKPAPPPSAPPPSARPQVACGHCHGRHTVEGVRLCSRKQETRGYAKRTAAEGHPDGAVAEG